MKKALWKDSFKEIRNTYKRFLSIVLMAFLGVGFFAGIKATSPDMVDTIDGYYKTQNVYDIEVLSTLGLTEKDVQALASVENVEKVYGTYEADGKLDIKNREVIAKVLCVEEMNQPILLEGKLPQNEKECVVEPSFLRANDKKIGDTITLEIADVTNDEGETIAYLKEKELEIVGTVKSPMYISSDRGTTSLGTGKINYYLYISKENIQASNVFTHIYIQVKDAEKWTTSTKSYEDYIEEVKQTIETIKEERETARQEELIGIATEKIAEVEEKLIDAKSKIADIEKPQWYILDRNANAGYVGFIQDTQSIAKIGQVFPVVFFVVAILISLTSMTRMVEEQRTQIGTLKALGYTKPQIASKYVIYASLASIIGGILGMVVGFILLPKVIWMMYSMMYQITDISIHFNIQYGGVGLLLISVCMVGATIFSAMKELNATPATLMRPKAPKMGKRVLLEKIPFIWKHLNFSKKVTVRNLFRYKKRVLMTIIGISGCTALILTGFGLRDSISSILPSQYEKIFHYDIQLNFKNGLEEEQKQAYVEKLKQKEEIEEITPIYMTSTSAVKEDKKEDVQIVVAEQEETLEKAIHVLDVKTKESISMQDGEIYITDKLAELIGAKQGDWIVLQNDNEEGVTVKIGNIVENYISHYVYMNQATYTALYQQEYTNNALLLNNKELTEEQEELLATELMEDKEVASITRATNSMRYMEDMLQLLNYVVVILIISAGLLAFVVLYNLSNVNISERIRELATIKVLGFYDQEVHSYVSRETVILTCIGIVIGLAGGFFLNSYIMGTCEINILRFPKCIQPSSYLIAALITIVFTVIVSIVTYFALKKIDMIESLKSVE